jgi:hypothetical protein
MNELNKKVNLARKTDTMETITAYSLISALLALFVIISGIWLMKTGEPYKPVVFAVHKIIVAALTVFLVLIIMKHLRLFSFSGLRLTFFILSAVFYVIAFISGAVLNFENIARDFLKTIHKVSSVLTVLMIPVIWLFCH